MDRRYSYRASLLVALLSSVAPVAVLANPVDGVVAAGSATISSAGATLTINQSTDKAIIDWRGFDIAAGETTQFVQPSSGSLTLNRVGSGSASQINGNLIANGNIIIINPNGVVFGAGSKVDVNGMVATSADISNSDVMAGDLRFTQPGNPNATIENHGEITAKDAGLIGLVAPNVINSGVITAKLGRIHLASGDTATVDLYGDGLISVKASDALTSQLVKNTGTLSAQGGAIAMTAAAGRQTVDSLIHVGGTLDARGIGTKNGKIYIYAEGSKAGMQAAKSRVVVDGKLDVSNSTGTGGKIEVLGDDIAVAPTAQINADGRDGGGIVHIGGDVQGKGTTPTALTLDMAAGALITANAMLDGNGGEVVMYADNRTVFNGRIEANGEGDGDGGFIETSGRVALLVGSGNVSATTRHGRQGEWLLDPADITITANTDANNSGGTPFTATATASQVSAVTIKGILDAGTNVTITTSNDGYAGNGDIIVSSAITTTGSGGLTLNAYRHIDVNAAITLNAGALTLRADNASTGTGTITIAAAISKGAGATIFTANNLVVSSGLTNTGTLAIAGITGTMGIGTGAGTLVVDTTELGLLSGSSYTFGSTTTGNMEINTAYDFGTKNVSFISGGNISLAGTLTKATGAGTATYLLQANGNISNSGSAGIAATTGAINLTMTSDNDVSGAGSITLTSAPLTVNGGTITLNSNGQSVTQSGSIGGDETINSSNGAVSIGTLDGDTAGTRSLTVNAGTATFTTTAAIGATNKLNNLSVTANDVALGANIGGTGTLTLQPTSTNRSIRLNNGSSDGTNLNLTTTEIGYFVNGWSGILIGAAAGHTDYINISATTWNDPVTFRGYYSRIYGNITGQDNASVSFTGSGVEFHSSSNVTTQGYGITFANAYVLYAGNNGIDSNGGNIAINGRITANLANIGTHTVASDNGTISIGNGTNAIQAGSVTSGSYSFNAGTNSLTFSGAVNTAANVTATAATITTASAWGASTGLGDVTLTSTNNLSLPAITTAAGKTVAVSVTGAGNRITTTGAIATGASGNITLSADDMTLGANLSGTGTLTVQPTSNNRLTYINYGASDGTNLNLTTTEIGYFVDGWSGIAIGKSSGSTAYMDVGATNWNDPVTFRGWYTRMRGTIAGLGNASLSFIGTGLEFITSSALLTTQGQTINLGTSTLDYSVYGTNTGIDSNGGAITINGRPLSQVGAFQNFTINSDGGNISMGGIRQATTVTNGSYIIDAGAGSLAFTSIVNTGANVTATAGSMTFSSIWGGTVTLGTASLTSSSALALPEIHATTLNINNSGAVTQTGYLALTNLSMAGAGSYTLNHASNNVGTIAANTSNTINFSNGNNGFTVGSVNSINGITTTGNNVTLSAGTGTLTTTQAIAVGAANLSLSADDMALGANLSGTGTLTVQPTSTNRPTYINYGASDGSNLNLTTTEIGYFVNGWSGINIGRTDAIAAGITNLGASSWNDPVSFRAYKNYLYGAVAGLGNASFGFSGVSDITELGTSGSLSTQNAAITMGELNISGTNNSIASNGSTITIAKIKDTGAAIGTLSVTSSNGAIAIGDTTNAIQSNGATSGTYSFNAGTNSVTFSGNVNTALGVTANGNSIVTGSGVWGGSTALGAVSLTSATTLALPTITASSIFAQTTGATADISIASGKTLTASGTGSAITLVAKRNFLNSAATPFSLTGGGRFLVYSTNPTDSVLGGRTSNFVRYSCTYGGTCPTFAAETGNGFLYTYTPTLTITPTAINLNYNDPVPSLTAYAYGVSGYLTSAAGNDATLDVRGSSINGTTNYTQGSAAGNYTINYSNGTLTSAQGYGFSYANNAAGIVVTGSGGGGGGNNTNSSTVPSTVTHSSQLPYMGEEMIWWWDDRAVEGEAENDAEEKIAATPEEEQRRKQSQQIGLPSFIELSPALQARLGIDI